MDITIIQIDDLFKEIFNQENGLVKSVDTVYEKAEDGYKYVISLHNIAIEDTTIAHTKFIFKTDDKKTISQNSFIYLYEINCVYHMVKFDSIQTLKDKLINIIESSDFGKDLIAISDFITSPSLFLNYYLKKKSITNYSVFEVKYEPKFNITPCDKTTFDFIININNNYDVYLSIYKIKEASLTDYKFKYRLLDNHIEINKSDLNHLSDYLGDGLVQVIGDLI